jgi:hypothetical protein
MNYSEFRHADYIKIYLFYHLSFFKDVFRSVFLWDLENIVQAKILDINNEYANTKCLILIAYIDTIHINQVKHMLATMENTPVKSKMAVLLSNNNVFIEIPGPYLFVTLVMHFKESAPNITGYLKMTSLCPTVGKGLSVKQNGLCPTLSTSLHGKSILLSYIGVKPYIYMHSQPVTGSDILILNLLAHKFKFSYTLKQETSFDWVKGKNGSNSGLIYAVRQQYK